MSARRAKPAPVVPRTANWNLWDIGIAALVILRWLVPTEGAEQGMTLWIATAWLACFTVRCWWLSRDNERQTPKITWPDVGVGLLVFGHLLSALLVVAQPGSGDRRAALNYFWEWVALGVTWVILRDLIRSAEFRRLLSGVLFITVIALAGLGIWQHFVWYPQQARDLTELVTLQEKLEQQQSLTSLEQKRRTELIAVVGNMPLTLDGAGRKSLLDRATHSVEPIGRFGLANSFASLLLLGTFLSLDEMLRQFKTSGTRTAKVISALILLLLFTCLLLTKSRTAVIGLIAGGGYLVMQSELLRIQWSNRRVLAILAVPVALVALLIVLVSSGGLDREVISEAPKSLRYRLEYWQATIQMIRVHGLFGVGPGNFRQHYLQYKLPGSSEEVLDPHNLFLDAWANGGTIAFIGICVLAIGWWGRCLQRVREENDQALGTTAWQPVLATGFAAFAVTYAEAWLFEGYSDSILLGLMATWFAVAATILLTLPGCEIRYRAAMALGCALFVHLLGAGGLGMPAILQLLLLALLLTNPRSVPTVTLRPVLLLTVSVVSLSITALCVWSSLLPVLTTTILSEQAHNSSGDSFHSRTAEKLLKQAIAADSLAPGPHQDLAMLLATRSLQNPNDKAMFEAAMAEFQAAIARDPLAGKRYQSLAEWLLTLSSKSPREGIATFAMESCESGIQRYPEFAPLWALLARSLAAAGRQPQSAARKALELDDLNRANQHFDKVLPESLRKTLEEMVSAPPASTN